MICVTLYDIGDFVYYIENGIVLGGEVGYIKLTLSTVRYFINGNNGTLRQDDVYATREEAEMARAKMMEENKRTMELLKELPDLTRNSPDD